MEDLLNKIEDTIPGEMIISLREVYRELDENTDLVEGNRQCSG